MDHASATAIASNSQGQPARGCLASDDPCLPGPGESRAVEPPQRRAQACSGPLVHSVRPQGAGYEDAEQRSVAESEDRHDATCLPGGRIRSVPLELRIRRGAARRRRNPCDGRPRTALGHSRYARCPLSSPSQRTAGALVAGCKWYAPLRHTTRGDWVTPVRTGGSHRRSSSATARAERPRSATRLHPCARAGGDGDGGLRPDRCRSLPREHRVHRLASGTTRLDSGCPESSD